MSRIATRLMMFVAAALAAGVLAIPVVLAAPASGPLAFLQPVAHAFSGPDSPGGGTATSPSTPACNAGEQETGEPQGQGAGEPPEQDANDANDAQACGTVASVDATHQSFVLTTANGPVTVVTTSQTEYKDVVASLNDLKPGMTVTVEGARQADGTLLAGETKGPVDGPENGTDQGDAGTSSND